MDTKKVMFEPPVASMPPLAMHYAFRKTVKTIPYFGLATAFYIGEKYASSLVFLKKMQKDLNIEDTKTVRNALILATLLACLKSLNSFP